jgi:hypothetical protein
MCCGEEGEMDPVARRRSGWSRIRRMRFRECCVESSEIASRMVLSRSLREGEVSFGDPESAGVAADDGGRV